MKAEDYNAALALYAAADQTATANLIELLTAAVLLKLAPPARVEDVATVTVSPSDIELMLRTHYFESRYEGDEMTIFLTPLGLDRGLAGASEA